TFHSASFFFFGEQIGLAWPVHLCYFGIRKPNISPEETHLGQQDNTGNPWRGARGRRLDRKTYAKAFCPRHQAKGENQNGWAEKSANIDSLRPTPQYFLHRETYEEKI